METFMREVSEAEVAAMVGESDCPVLGKEEAAEMEAAVCLKQFPQGYVLGISDKLEDLSCFLLRGEKRRTDGISTTSCVCVSWNSLRRFLKGQSVFICG
jgi:hypothetical protein